MALTDILRKLFSRNIIITNLPGNRLRAFDVNKLQSAGNKNNSNVYSRSKFRSSNKYSTWGYSGGNTRFDIESLRNTMYMDYEIMDKDSIISSALDIISDEVTSNDADGNLLIIKSEDNRIKKILYNLFYDVLNIEFNLWPWTRQVCKHGDFFLHLQFVETHGIINVTPIHPSLMKREENPETGETLFRYEGNGYYTTSGTKNVFEMFEIAHFRLLSDSNMLPYGKSMIEAARKEFKRLSLAEDAMLLHRIMRSPERRIFKIDVGNIPPAETDAHIEQIVAEMKRVPYIDEDTGEYNLRYNLLNSMEDYYLPVRGGDSGTSIETLPGLTNDGQMEDVEYLKTKMMAALKIPKAYLGYDESTAKANLANEDIRFARMIERVQKMIISELYKIAIIHLKSQGFKSEELLNFELALTSPSIIYERQKIDLLNEKFNLISNILESQLLSDIYIYENVLGLSEAEYKQEKLRVPEWLKTKFRYTQITDEGNDPSITKQSFGTPHDIATLQMASSADDNTNPESLKHLYSDDGRENNEGQPFKYNSFETKKDTVNGTDPTGRKQLKIGQNNLESMILKIDRSINKKRIL